MFSYQVRSGRAHILSVSHLLRAQVTSGYRCVHFLGDQSNALLYMSLQSAERQTKHITTMESKIDIRSHSRT